MNYPKQIIFFGNLQEGMKNKDIEGTKWLKDIFYTRHLLIITMRSDLFSFYYRLLDSKRHQRNYTTAKNVF